MKNLSVAAAFLLLSACVPPTTLERTDDMDGNEQMENMMIEDADPSNDDDDMIEGSESTGAMMQKGAVYAAFTSGVLNNGKPKVLFFYADRCPQCKEADEKLAAWFEKNIPTIDTYKLDYDRETTLKGKYGVTQQHTFVLVDGEGEVVQVIVGPGDAALKALVGA